MLNSEILSETLKMLSMFLSIVKGVQSKESEQSFLFWKLVLKKYKTLKFKNISKKFLIFNGTQENGHFQNL